MGRIQSLRGILASLNVDRAKRQQDSRRAAEAPLLSPVQDCARVGKYSGMQRPESLARQRAVRWSGQGRFTAAQHRRMKLGRQLVLGPTRCPELSAYSVSDARRRDAPSTLQAPRRRWKRNLYRNNGMARRSARRDELTNWAADTPKAPSHFRVQRRPHPQHAQAK